MSFPRPVGPSISLEFPWGTVVWGLLMLRPRAMLLRELARIPAPRALSGVCLPSEVSLRTPALGGTVENPGHSPQVAGHELELYL